MNIVKIIKKNQSIVFPIFDIALNGVNYFFHIYCSWYLVSKDYGVLNSLLSLIAILFVSGISFQTFTAKEISAKKNSKFIGRLFFIITIFAVIISSVFLIFFKFLIQITHSNLINIVLLIFIFVANIYLSVFRGIVQGKKEFINLNINFYIEVFSKILFLIMFLPVYKNIFIVLLSIFLGMILALIHLIKILKREINFKKSKTEIPIKEIRNIFVSNFYIYYFTSIDMIIVNYYIQSNSGVFAVILRYSQILMFVSFSLFTVFLPNLSEIQDDRIEFRKKASKFFIIFSLINFILLFFYYFLAPKTIGIMFGIKYIEAGKYLIFGAMAYFMLVSCFYIVNLNIVLKKKKYLIYLGIAAFLLSLILIIFHKDIKMILILEILIYSSLFLILLLNLKREIYKI